MSERKMATVRRISKISPIKGADAIELAHVDGWQSVVKKGEYQEGDLVVYLEINNKNHIVLINKFSFNRWDDPTPVEDWHNITREEIEEAVGSDFSFYKKEN